MKKTLFLSIIFLFVASAQAKNKGCYDTFCINSSHEGGYQVVYVTSTIDSLQTLYVQFINLKNLKYVQPPKERVEVYAKQKKELARFKIVDKHLASGYAYKYVLLNHKTNVKCKEDFCIETQDTKETIDFFVYTKDDKTISMDFTFSKVKNYGIEMDFNKAFVVPKNRKLHLATLTKKDIFKRAGYSTTYNFILADIHAKHNDSVLYALPYARGKAFKVGQSCNGSFSHKGSSANAIDFSLPLNTPVYAARKGKVIAIKDTFKVGKPDKRYLDKANYVEVMHEDGSTAMYAHLKYKGVVVHVGDNVTTRTLLGYSGNTGYSQGPHLHFVVQTRKSIQKAVSHKVKFNTKQGIIICPKKGSALYRN